MTGQEHSEGSAPAIRLRLLATSDLHMHLRDHDYHTDRAFGTGGLARIATALRNARAEARRDGRAVLLFDNGDALEGTALAEACMEDPARHPFADAVAELEFDAIGLGNHDFDYGLGALSEVARRIPCPMLCANIVPAAPSQVLPFRPGVILDVPAGDDTLRVGVFSVLPPQTAIWNRDHLDGLALAQPAETAAARIAAGLRRQGADIVVALAHMGLARAASATDASSGHEDAARSIASLRDVDAMIMGHAHVAFPGPHYSGIADVDARRGTVCDIPAVMPGMAGRHLGVIDLDARRDPLTGRMRVINHQSRLIDTDAHTTPEDPRIIRIAYPAHRRVTRQLGRPVGHWHLALHSYLSFLPGDAILDLVARAQSAAVRAHVPSDMPLFSAVSPMKTGARSGRWHYTDIPAGPLLERHLHDIYPFANDLRLLVLTGAEIADWLEHAAGIFNRVMPGQRTTPLINADLPGYHFDVLHGPRYRIDPSQPARYDMNGTRIADSHRIHGLTWRGAALPARMECAVVVNSYRANGGGHVAALLAPRFVALPRMSVRDALRQYLRDAPSGATPPGAPWRFASLQGTGGTLRTGPGLRRHLPDPARAIDLSVAGEDEDGFLNLAVAF
ncbi:MAG: 5'-nucleotidase C-terminal domain-containing protein [Rhodobacteraceae bacterium]|nr:5'-nucleotidase C-terminal domain-containing protein [Paracoccaceae bacterium]